MEHTHYHISLVCCLSTVHYIESPTRIGYLVASIPPFSLILWWLIIVPLLILMVLVVLRRTIVSISLRWTLVPAVRLWVMIPIAWLWEMVSPALVLPVILVPTIVLSPSRKIELKGMVAFPPAIKAVNKFSLEIDSRMSFPHHLQ